VIPQYEVHNFRIDLVVVGERTRLAVECDGEAWHGPEQYARDVARQRDLERCNWRFFRLRESEFYRDPDAALAPLWDLLKERGIWPRSYEPEPEPTPVEPVEPVPIATPEAPSGSAFAWFSPHEPRQEAPTSPLAAPEPPTEEAPHLVPEANEVEVEDEVEDEDDLDEAPWLEPEEDEQLILVETSVPNPLGLDPYVSWQPTPQPDPRSASRATLIDALTGIVAVEGPIVARRAYRLLLRASGGQRLGKLTRAPLNRAAAEAVRRGILADENPTGRQTQIDRVLRLPGSPKVRIRARGDRSLQEIPVSEVAALMKRLRSENPRLSPPELRRAVLDAYGLVRMTAKVLLYLDECIALSFEEPTP